MATGGQWRAAVKHADVVESKEAAFKEVLAKTIFTVHPPAEVQHQLGKRSPEEFQVGFAPERLFCPVQEYGCPRVHGRVDVAEVPLVSRDLPGRMQEKLLQHQVELRSRKIHIHRRERDGV